MKYINSILILLATLFFSCESMEETYEEFAGNGRIRYLAKCTNPEAIPGWESVKLTWENGIDPAIDHIVIEWSNGFVKKDTTIHKDHSTIDIPGLGNYTYEFKISSADKANNRSIESIAYCRPYTAEHDMIATFSNVVIKHFKVGTDVLVLFFDIWSDDIKEASLTYYVGTTEKTLQLDTNIVKEKFYTLSGVNLDMPVNIHRTAILTENVDRIEVPLPKNTLDLKARTFNNDFLAAVKNYLQINELTDAVIENVRELEIDYDISSLEDILYFPNLQKLTLGKNRYMRSYTKAIKPSQLFDKESSKYALKVAYELKGVVIDRYDFHFFNYKMNSWDNNYLSESIPYVNEKGNPVLPAYTYLATTDWSYTHTPAEEGHNSHIEYLFDGDTTTYWTPLSDQNSLRLHEIVFDMNTSQTFNAFQITQIFYSNLYDEKTYYLPAMINVHISDDGKVWEQATFEPDNILGMGSLETTVIKTFGEKSARFIKVILYDMPYSTLRYNVLLGGFAVIR